MDKEIILKPGREKAIKNRHHWIFSGAIMSAPEYENGDILPIYSANKEMLGYAYLNHLTSITGRMLSFGEVDPKEELKRNIDSAIKMREFFFDDQITNCYRLINSEGDYLPGLVVDRYNDVLVIQVTTAGIEKLKHFIVDYLVKKLKPRAVYEKSDMSSRREEGLPMFEGALVGEEPGEVKVLENGFDFLFDLKKSQKTGFFLDQRKMRIFVERLSKGRRVLNCFSYIGAFSLYALRGGATRVVSVDISADSMETSRRNFVLNHFDTENNDFIVEDVFKFLRERELNYDLIILDPPAFAKKKDDLVRACRGYKDINRLALQKIPAGGLLLTSSCSYHIDKKLFQMVVFQAAVEAKRKVRIIQRHHLAIDHPINIFHPEGEYLKSLLLYVE